SRIAFDRGWIAQVRDLGIAMTWVENQLGVLEQLDQQGWQDDAVKVARALHDPKIAAQLFLDRWGEQGALNLEVMIKNPVGAYPVESQMAAMEVVRDRFLDNGNQEAAARMDAELNALRAENRNENDVS